MEKDNKMCSEGCLNRRITIVLLLALLRKVLSFIFLCGVCTWIGAFDRGTFAYEYILPFAEGFVYFFRLCCLLSLKHRFLWKSLLETKHYSSAFKCIILLRVENISRCDLSIGKAR